MPESTPELGKLSPSNARGVDLRPEIHKESIHGDRIFVIHKFLTPQECQSHIGNCEAQGFEEAPLTTGGGFVMVKDIRNNDRVIVNDPVLAHSLFERARPFLPADWFGWEIAGFNERFRYYRYDPGQKFAPHYDGYFERENGERSHFTFMVYLNEGFEGGETVFQQFLGIQPQLGKALVFFHDQLHEGAEVRAGRKYVLRTDVMYQFTGKGGYERD